MVESLLLHQSVARPWIRRLAILGIFLAGAIVGASVYAIVLHTQRLRMHHDPSWMHRKLCAEVQQELGLDDEQTAAVARALEERHRAFEAMRAEMEPRFDREIGLMESSIADVLPAEKREHWHEFFQEFRAKWLPPPRPRTPPESK